VEVKTASPLAVRRFGKGGRRVLALHCTLAHAGAWRGLAEAMPDEIGLLAPDMFGHGRSPDWDGSGDFTERMVSALVPLIDAPVDVVGHSMGGVIALHLAAWHSQLVRSLTLIEPVLFGIVAQEAPALLKAQAAQNAPFEAAIATGDFDAAARLFNGGWGAEGGRSWADTPEAVRAAMARGVRIVPACAPAVTKDRFGLFAAGGLNGVTMPVRLLHGDQTQPIVAAANQGVARQLPQARVCVVAGAGHMLPITHPVAVADQLRAVFRSTPI
jgi:pimeloyl-ACP methyl ester carboxylesterase